VRTSADLLVDDTDEPSWSGLEVHGDLVEWEAHGLSVERCRLTSVQLTGARLERARFADTVFESCELSGAVLEGATFRRVELRQCRLVGLVAGAASFVDVRIDGCKLDRSTLVASTAERLVAEGSLFVECDLRDVRWPAARLERCDLTAADVGGARLAGASVRGSALHLVRNVRGLAGATVDAEQLLALAPLLAADAGILVGDA
jgi:uncharacterized protein YjbI with pentapeptide repeats